MKMDTEKEVGGIVRGTVAELQETESPFLNGVAARLERELAELEKVCSGRKGSGSSR